MSEFEELIEKKGLPRVGQTVRSKDYNTLWRVIGKREMWQNVLDDPKTGQPRLVPAVHLTYWRIREGVQPGIGKTMGFTYTLYDNTFEAHWEVVS